MTQKITKLMMLAEAREIMKTQRLVFGDPTQIEARELVEMANEAAPLGSFKRTCHDCGGYGTCACEDCEEGDSEKCKADGICPTCDGKEVVKVLLTGPTAEKLTAKAFREALGRR